MSFNWIELHKDASASIKESASSGKIAVKDTVSSTKKGTWSLSIPLSTFRTLSFC